MLTAALASLALAINPYDPAPPVDDLAPPACERRIEDCDCRRCAQLERRLEDLLDRVRHLERKCERCPSPANKPSVVAPGVKLLRNVHYVVGPDGLLHYYIGPIPQRTTLVPIVIEP
jgi:hypothetical protein